MSKKQDTDLANKFSLWLENRTGEQQGSIEQQDFSDESLWQQRHAVAERLAHHADVAEQAQVPNWDRGAAFSGESVNRQRGDTLALSWWQWRGLPVASMAFSFLAIAMVLLKVELVVKSEGIMLSFAGNREAITKQQVAQLVDQRLQTFASEQQVVLANYAADIKVKQQESNLQLASYIMGASRQERKEDITEFIKYINDQRADEQFEQNMKFKQLEQAIKYRNTRFDNSLALQPQAADWTTEE